ncbi:uncharacterized protein LOC130734435 [Lotus japonicus]|uniref:uncharacterized protein LOC130734435 n=1 Tax=Lotus japonicus TaxID=34305 RepID=UPI00258F306F|nr:uncharacterized protein LOC130734435 [Lotus japonicus]XP_057442847.1 uncharacterized protein LOC130734435 [Lotus japonicus]
MVLPQKKGIKQLAFETEESPSKKMIPSLPINTKSTPGSVIDISDSDDEPTQDPVPDRQASGNIFISTSFAAEKGKNSHGSCAQNNEENLDFSEEPLFVANTKRKRTCNVVTSESESDDDNLPISQLKRTHIQKASADRVAMSEDSSLPAAISEDDKVTDNVKIRRRRLQPLRECLSKIHNDKMSSRRRHRAKHQQSVPANNDQSVEDLSDGEEESTGSFIVDDDDSDVFDCEVTCSKSSRDEFNSDVDSASSNLQDVSDGEMNFGKILSKIQRRKKNAMKWEYQADMLAEFGKDSELCMKAVCSLYKQQTSEEQMSKESMCHNNRGFSKCDAPRGSDLGEYLTEGDPSGGLKKSVEELQEYDPEAVEECRTLATRYSKQLYEIYKNNEDPFFP